MIGIVVVSHSRALAEAAVGLARQMLDESTALRIEVAAGLEGGELGTDATAVAAALENLADADGVLVLVDLGSAVLSADLALELVDDDVRSKVRISSAPVVEGLVAAAVTASTGADLATVADEAARSLAAKAEHLDDDSAPVAPVAEGPPASSGATESAEVRVADPHGLHARPAAAVARAAAAHDAEVWLTDLDGARRPVAARSLSAVATLGAGHRALVRVEASGPDAADAVREVAAVLTGEPRSAAPAGPREPAAPGNGLDVAVGPAVVARGGVSLDGYVAGTVDAELERSSAAVATTSARLGEIGRAGDADTAAVLAAQQLLLEDPEVRDAVAVDIRSGTPAPHAWRARLDAVAAELGQLPDPYQRERATDVRSVRDHLLRALTGTDEVDAGRAPGVLVVDELDAATAATVDAARTAGIVTVAGGATGHGALVARARGIPLLAGAGAAADGVRDGRTVAFDARSRELWVEPDDETRREVEARIEQRTTERAAVLERAAEPAVTRGGVRVPVLANVASVAEAEAAAAWADGSGLVRTELLLGGPERPDVEEQERVLRQVVTAFGGRPVTLRTWDVGADKPLPYLPRAAEENPALGSRGVRMIGTPAEPLLVDQLRAVCRVAAAHPLRLMFPMVTTRHEVDEALRLLAEAAAVETGGVPSGLEVGIMVEVPAAALSIADVAVGLDFVSVGTNDLTQYVTAADRGNPAVSHLVAGVSPAVLRLIAQVVDERPDGVKVSVCGDLASRPAVVPDLLRLGVDELSCAPAVVPEVKAAVRACD